MPFIKYPVIHSFEEFMAEIEKKDELRNRYFYEQIIWGEKERHKLNQKSKKYMERRRNKERGLSEVNKPPENTAAAPPAKPAQNPQPKPILLYQGDTKRRSSVLSIPDASLFPKTTQNGQIVNLYNLVNKNPNA